MQISLTKKLCAAMGIKPGNADGSINPLFCWTANWTNTFSDRREDMVVLVNHANQFTVTIYGIRRNQFKNIETKMLDAIKNTLLAMNLNLELVDDYLRQAGEVTYAANHDKKMTACVNRQGLDAAFTMGRMIHKSERVIKYEDTEGATVSRGIVNYGKNHEDAFVPADEMIRALSELTGKTAYRYRAFEIRVILDLDIYEATRRLIVPADIELQKLHETLQKAFSWEDCHLYDFTVYNEEADEPIARLVPDEESLAYDSSATLLYDHKLSEYLPQHTLLYTYDMGDNWEHRIEFVRTIDEHNEDSPFLLEAEGQAPPENVGGVGGFLQFREIMFNPEHPDYDRTKEWVRYWSPDLYDWQRRPRVLHSI